MPAATPYNLTPRRAYPTVYGPRLNADLPPLPTPIDERQRRHGGRSVTFADEPAEEPRRSFLHERSETRQVVDTADVERRRRNEMDDWRQEEKMRKKGMREERDRAIWEREEQLQRLEAQWNGSEPSTLTDGRHTQEHVRPSTLTDHLGTSPLSSRANHYRTPYPSPLVTRVQPQNPRPSYYEEPRQAVQARPFPRASDDGFHTHPAPRSVDAPPISTRSSRRVSAPVVSTVPLCPPSPAKPPICAQPSSPVVTHHQRRSVSTPVETVVQAVRDRQKDAFGPHITLDELEEDVTCSICLQIIVAAHGMSPCGHTICGGCANEWIREKTTCPACRAQLTRETPIVPLLGMDAIISKWVQKQGSAWEGLADWQERCEMWQAHRAFNEQTQWSRQPRSPPPPADDPYSNWVHQGYDSTVSVFAEPLSGSFVDRHDRAMFELLTGDPQPRSRRNMLFPSSFAAEALRGMMHDSMADNFWERFRNLRL